MDNHPDNVTRHDGNVGPGSPVGDTVPDHRRKSQDETGLKHPVAPEFGLRCHRLYPAFADELQRDLTERESQALVLHPLLPEHHDQARADQQEGAHQRQN